MLLKIKGSSTLYTDVAHRVTMRCKCSGPALCFASSGAAIFQHQLNDFRNVCIGPNSMIRQDDPRSLTDTETDTTMWTGTVHKVVQC